MTAEFCCNTVLLVQHADLARSLESAAGQAMQSWLAGGPGVGYLAAAKDALVKENIDLVRNPDAAHLLSTAVCGACREIAQLFALDPYLCSENSGAVRERDGKLALDAALADWTARQDAQRGQAIRDSSHARLISFRAGGLDAPGLYKLWIDGAGGALTNVARTLWRTRVGAQLQQLRDVPPALVRNIAMDLAPVLAGRIVLSEDGKLRDGQREIARLDVAAMDAATLDMVRRQLRQFRTVTAHRLLRLLVLRVHDQVNAGSRFALRVHFDGGWSALADELHETSKDFATLQDLVEAGARVCWTRATFGNLWHFDYHRGNAAAPTVLSITVGEDLAPGEASRRRHGLKASGDASLVAWQGIRLVPELRRELPLGAANRQDQGAAWLLARLVLVELVDAAPVLATEGSVPIDEHRWHELADQALLPKSTLARLRNSWIDRESDTAPALLAQPAPGRYTLAQSHELERAFIEEGGRQRTIRSKAGKFAAASRLQGSNRVSGHK